MHEILFDFILLEIFYLHKHKILLSKIRILTFNLCYKLKQFQTFFYCDNK